jgi:hypothetical protein
MALLMQYRKPDSRWKIVTIPDWKPDLEHLVIKGLFRESVLKDVIEAYEVAEYLMADAYYQYPLSRLTSENTSLLSAYSAYKADDVVAVTDVIALQK